MSDDFDQVSEALAAQQVLVTAMLHGLIAHIAKSSDDPNRSVKEACERMTDFINDMVMPGADDAPEWERAKEVARRAIDHAAGNFRPI